LQVDKASPKRYQQWFAERYLNTPQSETLVCDLIRFIVCNYHPSNEVCFSTVSGVDLRERLVIYWPRYSALCAAGSWLHSPSDQPLLGLLQILASRVIPRWMVIAWLLKCTRTIAVAQYAKLVCVRMRPVTRVPAGLFVMWRDSTLIARSACAQCQIHRNAQFEM